MKILLISALLLAGCTHKNCLKESNIYQSFQELFEPDEKLLVSSSREDIRAYESDKRLRDTIFSQICNTSIGYRRLLFARKVVALNQTQTGLLYLNKDSVEKVFYFQKIDGVSVIVGEGTNNFYDLVKLLTILKDDFYQKTQQLREYFNQKNLGDVPSVQIAFVDFSNDKTTKDIVSFGFGHLDDLFDKTFNVETNPCCP